MEHFGYRVTPALVSEKLPSGKIDLLGVAVTQQGQVLGHEIWWRRFLSQPIDTSPDRSSVEYYRRIALRVMATNAKTSRPGGGFCICRADGLYAQLRLALWKALWAPVRVVFAKPYTVGRRKHHGKSYRPQSPGLDRSARAPENGRCTQTTRAASFSAPTPARRGGSSIMFSTRGRPEAEVDQEAGT